MVLILIDRVAERASFGGGDNIEATCRSCKCRSCHFVLAGIVRVDVNSHVGGVDGVGLHVVPVWSNAALTTSTCDGYVTDSGAAVTAAFVDEVGGDAPWGGVTGLDGRIWDGIARNEDCKERGKGDGLEERHLS